MLKLQLNYIVWVIFTLHSSLEVQWQYRRVQCDYSNWEGYGYTVTITGYRYRVQGTGTSTGYRVQVQGTGYGHKYRLTLP